MKRSGFRKPTADDVARRRMRRTLQRGRVLRTCKACGSEFAVYPHRALTAKTCSTKCAGVLKQTKVSRVCRTCGATFMFAPSQLNKSKGAGKYCSHKCSHEGYVQIVRARPIKDRYGRSRRADDRKWQLAVRLKDDYTCQRCGKQEPYVHAHHVAPRSRRPDLKHEVSNGKCLCNSCHTWVHQHPREATEAGLLSVETYEVVRANGRRSDNVLLTHRNTTLRLIEWADVLGVKSKSLRCRWGRGWTPEQILETPLKGSSVSPDEMKATIMEAIVARETQLQHVA